MVKELPDNFASNPDLSPEKYFENRLDELNDILLKTKEKEKIAWNINQFVSAYKELDPSDMPDLEHRMEIFHRRMNRYLDSLLNNKESYSIENILETLKEIKKLFAQ